MRGTNRELLSFKQGRLHWLVQSYGTGFRLLFEDMGCLMQGLGFPSESGQNLSAPFVSMLQAGLLDQSVFTLWLNPDTTNSYAGELSFGTVNGERYFGNIRYLNIAPSNGP